MLVSILNATKDMFSMSKIYTENYLCQLDLDTLLGKELLLDMKNYITEKELEEINALKSNFCRTSLKSLPKH